MTSELFQNLPKSNSIDVIIRLIELAKILLALQMVIYLIVKC